jgi:hypothetical protein
MSYSVALREYPDHLRVEVSGEWTPGHELEDAVDVWTQVADCCRKSGLTRILSVWDVPGRLPPLVAYELVGARASGAWDRRFRLALVQLREERFKDSQFVETLAVNRGYNVRVFDNEPDARSWLLQP